MNIEAIINGMKADIEVNAASPISALVMLAVNNAPQGNAGHPGPNDWEVRNEAGALLGQTLIVGETLPDRARVFVNLHAGTGG